MASLLRRSATPARKLLLLPRHLATAGSAPASSRSISQYHPRDGSPRYDPLGTPANWGVTIVPGRKVFVVERLGKYHKTLTPGIHLLVPGLDRIAFVQSLKEQVIPISVQSVLTRDGVCLQVNGGFFVKIVDPYLASYGAENPIFAVTQLAQTTMRSELGKMALDETFKGRDALNENIVRSINEAAIDWGLECIRFEIAEAQVNLAISKAKAHAIELISEALAANGGTQAANLLVAEKIVAMADTGKTLIFPSPEYFLAQVLKMHEKAKSNSKTG